MQSERAALGMTEEELLIFREFALCVERVLDGVERKDEDERRGLDWEDALVL